MRPVAILALVMLLACAREETGTNDETEGVSTESGGSTGEGSSGGAPACGVDDPDAACVSWCEPWVECTGTYATADECVDACRDDLNTLALLGTGCWTAAVHRNCCVGELSCDELAAWSAGLATAECRVEEDQVQSACGG